MRNPGCRANHDVGSCPARSGPWPHHVEGTLRNRPQTSVRRCSTTHFGGLESYDEQDRYNRVAQVVLVCYAAGRSESKRSKQRLRGRITPSWIRQRIPGP